MSKELVASILSNRCRSKASRAAKTLVVTVPKTNSNNALSKLKISFQSPVEDACHLSVHQRPSAFLLLSLMQFSAWIICLRYVFISQRGGTGSMDGRIGRLSKGDPCQIVPTPVPHQTRAVGHSKHIVWMIVLNCKTNKQKFTFTLDLSKTLELQGRN